jgi:hypothetical protein
MVVGTAVCLVAVAAGPAAREAVSGTGSPATRGTADPRFRLIRPAPDVEVVLRAGRQEPIGAAGRSPLGTGARAPLCQAIKGTRGQAVRARGCGLPLLRPRPLQKTGLTTVIGPRPSGSALSQAQLKALAARIEGAVDREWAKFLRRAGQGVPAIDPTAKKVANSQAEAIRRDRALLEAAEQVRQAAKSNLSERLDRYRRLVRKYTTWLPGLRRSFVDLAGIHSIHELRKPLPTTVEVSVTGPTATLTGTYGDGDDWETSDQLQLILTPRAGTQVSVHARAGFNSWARHTKSKYWRHFTVPAGAGDVEVEISASRSQESRLDDCFGFAQGSASTDISVYRLYGDGNAHPPVAWSRTWDHADVLSSPTTCGFTLPAPDPPALDARAPTVLRFTAPASGAEYFVVTRAEADASVAGGGTAVVEQDLTIESIVVRYRG